MQRSNGLARAAIAGWVADGASPELQGPLGEPLSVLVRADDGGVTYVEAEVSRHPDPAANAGAFALHGRAPVPDGTSGSAALLRIFRLDIIAGSSVQRTLAFSSDYRRAPLHLAFATGRVDARERAMQPEPLAEPPPLGLGFQAGDLAATLSPATFAPRAYCIQRSVVVLMGGSGAGEASAPPPAASRRVFIETHAMASMMMSLLPEALSERFEWWLRTPVSLEEDGGGGGGAADAAAASLYAATVGGAGSLLPAHLARVLPGGGLLVGYPRFELPGAAAAASAAASAQADAAASDALEPSGASNSVGFFEAQLALVQIRGDGSAAVSCPASAVPGADAAASRLVAAAAAGTAPAAVVVRRMSARESTRARCSCTSLPSLSLLTDLPSAPAGRCSLSSCAYRRAARRPRLSPAARRVRLARPRLGTAVPRH